MRPDDGNLPKKRVYYLNAVILVGVFCCVFFSLINYSQGNPVLATAELAAAVLAMFNLLYFRKSRNYDLAASVSFGIMFLLLLVLLKQGGIEGTGAFWFFTFPLLALFLTGRKKGLKWIVALYWAVLAILGASIAGYLQIAFSPVEIRQLLASLAAVTALAYLYQWTIDRYQTLMEENNARLRQEVVIRKQTAKELERALVTEKRFLASMNHEIRTPLNAILGFVDLLEHTRLDTAQREYLDNVFASSRHLGELINDALDVSKLEAGQLELSRVEIDLGKLLRDAATIAATRANAGVRLDVELPNFLFAFWGDPVRIRQIFVNLIGNAAKFTQQGCIRLALEGTREQGEKTLLRLVVDDTGKGIPTDRLQDLFQPFRQAHEQKSEGTGLGLYLSRSLARIMGGEIYVESREGEGSRFTVELSLERSDRPVEELARRTRGGAPGDFSALKILVAEDVEMNVLVIREMMKSYFKTDFDLASNGRQAVEMAMGGQYDLIFMDIQMPEMDGFQATEVIRQTDRLTPIYAMSATALKGYVRNADAVGMNGYITKPVRREDLENVLQKVAGNQVATGSVAGAVLEES